MGDAEGWIEARLAAALKATTTENHAFPDAVGAEFRKLLAGPLQEARKPAELDGMATSLIAANRGEK
jgi:hypothetical protein